MTHINRLFLVLTVTICLSACSSSGKLAEKDSKKIPLTTVSDKARNFFIKALSYENLNKLDSAKILLDKAIQLDAAFAMASLKRGMLSGNYDKRRKLIAAAMTQIDNISEGERLWILARNAFYGTGDSSKEFSFFESLVKAYPKDENANYLFGYINYHHGNNDYDNAIKYLSGAVDIKPDFTKAYNDLAYVYLEKKNFEMAKKMASKNIELLPDQLNPYDTYAEILMREGNYEASIEAYARVLEIDSKFPWAIMGTVANLNFLNRYTEAREFHKKLESVNNLTDYQFRHTWRSLVVSYIDEGKLSEAIHVLECQKQMGINKTTTHEPFFHAYYAFLRKTRLYFEMRDWESGLKEYERWNSYVSNNSTNANTLKNVKDFGTYYKAYAYFLKGNTDQAYKTLALYKASKGDKENDLYRVLLSKILMHQNKPEEALAVMEMSNLENSYHQYIYGSIWKKLGKQETANQWFRKITTANELNVIDLALVRKKALEILD